MNLDEYMELIKRNEIPQEPPNELLTPDPWKTLSLENFECRSICNQHGLWIVVADSWIKELAHWIGDRKCLEIMAGGGHLAKGLRKHGIDVIATDDYSWSLHSEAPSKENDVRRYDAVDAVKTFIDTRILIVSWPPYRKSITFKACDEWNTRGPIVYIGEDYGGCNATDEFFEHFCEDENSHNIRIPQWAGLHDRLIIGCWQRNADNHTST